MPVLVPGCETIWAGWLHDDHMASAERLMTGSGQRGAVPGMFPLGRIPAYKSELFGAGPDTHAICRNRPTDTVVLAFDRPIDLRQFHAAAGDDRDDQRCQRGLYPAHRCDVCRAAAPAEPGRCG